MTRDFNMIYRTFVIVACLILSASTGASVLDKQKLLDRQTFWDNRDSPWFAANIPFFECPDAEITTTYYYRWELLTKHLTYGSPTSGYSFTEFMDRPFWSGAYGAISCPAGHQLYEARWLRDPRYVRDYSRYWFRTPGAQPRNYSTWLADAVWAAYVVQPDKAFITDLLGDLVKNFDGWADRQWVKEVGMFWQIGHDDGMEFNISSRQSKDILRGAPGYRPSFNAYMWADAMAIARIADLAGDTRLADRFRKKASELKEVLQAKLWDAKREFFFPMYKNDEQDQEGNQVKAGTLTYQSGKFAGNEHGREEIGFVPWQFNLPDPGFEVAWKFLMDPAYFYADRGPTTVERNDPMFLLQKSCCWWSGQSWPYATTQTLKAMANLLQNYHQDFVNRADYVKLLHHYALSHRKQGKPYLAEALHPDTGSFEGHDGYNHSEHYFHSGFCDLVITGLAGLKAQDGDTLEVDPLAPADWDYFALDDVPYQGHLLAILWDRKGDRYGMGPGLHVRVDGKVLATSPTLAKLSVKLPVAIVSPAPATPRMNYAVNNDGHYFPRFTASYTAAGTSLAKVNDGGYWYSVDPPNRWTCVGSPNATDWIAVNFGIPRRVDTVKLYLLDDVTKVTAPANYRLEFWDGLAWQLMPGQTFQFDRPTGHRANTVTFPAIVVQMLRVVFEHAKDGRTGLTEFEAWGEGTPHYMPAPPPVGNLALNQKGEGFPKATASFSDQFGGIPSGANDGRINFLPTPMNRWTSYGSPHDTDWLEVDFGGEKEIGRVELYVYDDRGGVQPPKNYSVQFWKSGEWHDAERQVKTPEMPAGGVDNTVTFDRVKTAKVRVVFTHQGKARSGVTEMEAWRE